jgi:site-specific DNA-methyltransferase (adenine-specific)
MATSGDRDDRELVPEARQWSGWGTALKPAHEPICVARKPFKGTVAANVLEHGTGALNIDACRVATGDKLGGGNCKGDSTGKFVNDGWRRPWMDDAAARDALAERVRGNVEKAEALGRWPANVIHDGSTEVLEAFAEFGERGAFAPVKGTEPSSMTKSVFGQINRQASNAFHGDTGTAARFFYCAKASRADRNHGLEDPGPQFKKGTTLRDVEVMAAAGEIKGNTHPTVKPTDLMAYLCRLVTPAGGVVLDPFMGSGSTGKEAMRERFRFIGIDMTPEYVEIARARIDASWRAAEAVRQVCEPSPQIDLFEEMA